MQGARLVAGGECVRGVMSQALAVKYATPVPRYTSYPTTPHFSPAVTIKDYATWLEQIAGNSTLSLYVHIPFCNALCWFCACHTQLALRYEPVVCYLEALLAEISSVSKRVPRSHTVTHMHWGGGSPNVLSAEDIGRLARALQAAFQFSSGVEFAVELDPRGLNAGRVQALRREGMTRASIGAQDFDARVQKAINRVQSFDTTRQAVELLRSGGATPINIDLVYGLPYQTLACVERTIAEVLRLKPDRVSAFGYAHLPNRLKRQRLIDDAALPNPEERFELAARIAELLVAAGYVRVGLDHFAHPTDKLATAKVHRNFQGYTTDDAEVLIGLGSSAISKLQEGYVQNATPATAYDRNIHECGLATVRGKILTMEDRARAFVIERLMCDLEFPLIELVQRFGGLAEPLIAQARRLVGSDADGLLQQRGESFRVTERGRPFLRSICACFDAYFAVGAAEHSTGA